MGDLERLRCYNDADHVRVRDAMLRLQQLHWSGSDAALLSFHRDGVMSALHCEGHEAGEHHEMDDIFGRPAYGIAQCCFSLALSTKCTCGCAIKLSEAQETNIMQLSMAHFGAKIAADNQSATKTLQRAFEPWIGRSNCKKCGQMELHQRRIVDHLPLTLLAGATFCVQRAVMMRVLLPFRTSPRPYTGPS